MKHLCPSSCSSSVTRLLWVRSITCIISIDGREEALTIQAMIITKLPPRLLATAIFTSIWGKILILLPWFKAWWQTRWSYWPVTRRNCAKTSDNEVHFASQELIAREDRNTERRDATKAFSESTGQVNNSQPFIMIDERPSFHLSTISGGIEQSSTRFYSFSWASREQRTSSNLNQSQSMSHQPSDKLRYQEGFGNHFSTEAIPGSLPKGQNTPQVCPHGKYVSPNQSGQEPQSFLHLSHLYVCISLLIITSVCRSIRGATLWYSLHGTKGT